MIEQPETMRMSQMEIDLRRMFNERIHKCCTDLVDRCFDAGLDPRCGPAIIGSQFTYLSAKLTASLTDMTATEYLRICRANFEAARKKEEAS